MNADIKGLLRLEAELKTPCERETSPFSLDAKVNILKYLQVQTVLQFQAKYDDLYYELSKTGELNHLLSIAPARSKHLFQPKVLDLQDCGKDEQLEEHLKFYLGEAESAKERLDELVTNIARDSSKYEVLCAEVKSRESTRRKASRFYGGDVRMIADMARVTVVCATPEALNEAYLAIIGLPEQEVPRVKNGFKSDWMPSGYRDVKLNPVVKDHLCEIQLHLREFFDLKGGQHAVYEWARELNVTTKMSAKHLFQHLSPEVTKEMMRLAGQNWRGTGYCLPDLQLAAGQPGLAEKSLRQQLRDGEHKARGIEDDSSKEGRRAMLLVQTARATLAGALQHQGKYEEADSLYLRAIEIGEATLGPDHPDVATRLNNRAALLTAQVRTQEDIWLRTLKLGHDPWGCWVVFFFSLINLTTSVFYVFVVLQGRYEEAAALYERSSAIRESVLGRHHPAVATTLNNWAELLRTQGKYTEAEPLYERSQDLREKVLGPQHPDVAGSLSNWAGLLSDQGRYEEADLLHLRAIEVGEKALGPDHPDLATWLNNRAGLLYEQGKYEEAEPLFERCQAIKETALGAEHPSLATTLNSRAVLLRAQGKYNEARPLYERSLVIREKSLGPDHVAVATTLNNRARLLESQGKYEEADPLALRVLEILGATVGREHPKYASALNNRAGLLRLQGKCAEAKPLFEQCQAIFEKAFGSEHAHVATALNNRAGLLKQQGKYAEAEPLFERCQAIQEKVLSPDHPSLAATLNNRAGLLLGQGKYAEAEPLFERCQAIYEKVLGSKHPNVAKALNNRAGLLKRQGKYEEADSLLLRVLEILDATVGTQHPNYASALNNRVGLLKLQGKYEEADSLLMRVLDILGTTVGREHPSYGSALNNRAELLRLQRDA
ncbi:unnamed protein product [Ectocarpus fasciculatus]